MIMKKVLFIMAVSAMAAGCADNSIPKAQLPELDLSNPLLAAWDTPHETPPFSEIKLADYEPAFDAAIACSRAEIDAIVNNPRKPTFGNTIVALERQGELLNRIAGLFFNLLEADTSDEMQEIAQRVQPKLTELSNDISLNPELFARVVIVAGDTLVPVRSSKRLSIDRIALVRREAKRKVFIANAERALRRVAPDGDLRQIGSVALVGGSSQDFEIADLLAEHLMAYRITTGRANLLGFLPPHSAVALGLALADDA